MVEERLRQEAVRSDNPMEYLFGNKDVKKNADKQTPPTDANVEKRATTSRKEMTAKQNIQWMILKRRLMALGTPNAKIESLRQDFLDGKRISF